MSSLKITLNKVPSYGEQFFLSKELFTYVKDEIHFWAGLLVKYQTENKIHEYRVKSIF